MKDVIERFAGDLRASGVEEDDVVRTTQLYDLALVNGSDLAWRRFYRATFFALNRGAERVLLRSPDAIASLLGLLGDDLGEVLFDAGVLARLGGRLCRPRLVRPSADKVQHRHRNVWTEAAIAVTFRHHADDRRHADDHHDD